MDAPRFELVSKYTDKALLPVRSTKNSAGYDFFVAEDIIVPSYFKLMEMLNNGIAENEKTPGFTFSQDTPITLDAMAAHTKGSLRPTLVPTGVKAYMPDGYFLQLAVRSSCPLKYWLTLANGVGIIDADYVDNEQNEGEIFFQIINWSPKNILLQKGDRIGQGIFIPYQKVIDDCATAERSGGMGSTGA